MDLPPDELRRLMAEGEGRALEFKQGLPRDEKTARSLCAFANTRGGLLLIGVDDHGKAVGVRSPKATMARLRAIAAERLDPPLEVEAGSVGLEEGRVVWCSVPLSPARPHARVDDAGKREVVVRVGASNRVATGATLAAIGPGSRTGGLDDLERKVLAWVAARARAARTPGGGATVAGFAKAHNVGVQRARRAFVRLERDGRLVGHGAGSRRVYGPV